MAKLKGTEAAVIETLEGYGDESPVVHVTAKEPAPHRIVGKLTAARVVDQRHRARDYPDSERFRIRALGGEHEAAYVVAPAGPEAEAMAVAEYMRLLGLPPGAKLNIRPMPD